VSPESTDPTPLAVVSCSMLESILATWAVGQGVESPIAVQWLFDASENVRGIALWDAEALSRAQA